jgi:hypothetical protein
MLDFGQTSKARSRENHEPCTLCDQNPEVIDHLLLFCVQSRDMVPGPSLLWLALDGTSATRKSRGLVAEMRRRLPKPQRQVFDSLVILIARSLWLCRNACVFRGVSPLVGDVLRRS